MTTPAGQFNRTVTLRALTATPDDYGGQTEAESTLADVRAKVEPLTGFEQLRAMQTGMERPHRFTIRYRPDITGATRVLYEGRTFNVTSVIDPDAKHRELVILADEVA